MWGESGGKVHFSAVLKGRVSYNQWLINLGQWKDQRVLTFLTNFVFLRGELGAQVHSDIFLLVFRDSFGRQRCLLSISFSTSRSCQRHIFRIFSISPVGQGLQASRGSDCVSLKGWPRESSVCGMSLEGQLKRSVEWQSSCSSLELLNRSSKSRLFSLKSPNSSSNIIPKVSINQSTPHHHSYKPTDIPRMPAFPQFPPIYLPQPPCHQLPLSITKKWQTNYISYFYTHQGITDQRRANTRGSCLMGTGDVGLRLLQKKLVFIKLMEETKTQSMEEDPFLGMFAEGMDEFARYQCHKAEGKSQRHREKIQRYERDANDRELKKQRNKVRRDAEKQRVKLSFGTKTPEEIKSIKDARHVIWRQEREKVTAAMKTGQVVMIDLVFEDKMNGKENKSLGKQVELITKAIKHIDHPPSVHLCSFGGQAEVILNRMGVPHWSVTSHTEDILEVGKILNKKLVYLSPDAEDCLESVEHDTAYILGGLIDRSIIKNASLSRARDLGIEARKLPIRQFMKNRGVLNIDHVVMMILKFQECNDWKTAFTHACPKRWKIDDEEPQKEASMDKDKEASINQDEQKPQPPSQTQTQSEQKTETC